jgi:hypothetical protein
MAGVLPRRRERFKGPGASMPKHRGNNAATTRRRRTNATATPPTRRSDAAAPEPEPSASLPSGQRGDAAAIVYLASSAVTPSHAGGGAVMR